jgi:hypothetical protein
MLGAIPPPTPNPIFFMARYVVKYRDNFTSTGLTDQVVIEEQVQVCINQSWIAALLFNCVQSQASVIRNLLGCYCLSYFL